MSEHYTMPQTVYFLRPIGGVGPIKIGCSSVPQKRLETMMAWSPVRLEIIVQTRGGYKEEQKLHRVFADLHDHGEWFNPSTELQALIQRVAAGDDLAAILSTLDDAGSVRAKYRKPWCEGRRAYQGMLSRLHAAERRAEKARDCNLWWPADLRALHNELASDYRVLTEAEAARVAEVCADPESHFLTYPEAYPGNRVPNWVRLPAPDMAMAS